MPPGAYTLLVRVPGAIEVEFGAAGTHALDAGWAAYTGSAFGPGGLARVDRHREVSTGKREVRHWHIDHLLGHPATRIEAVWVSPDEAVECPVHQALPGREVPVGASDCGCEGHLRATRERESLVQALDRLHATHREG